MLELKQIKKDYVTSSETVHALRGIDITFRDHEFVSILGPSGCGKTTLLNIVGGLDGYTDGDLVINGRSTKSYKDRDWDVYRNHRVGFIFQSYNLIPHQTVLGNVELALTIAGIDREERVARAKRALDRVGLAGQYYKRPNQLSGGQCQRVAIARALVNDPEILLADEPTGALDTVTSVQIMNLIREIAGERLVIMVTHNPELAEEYSTRIVRLLDGNIIEDTNPVSAEEAAAPTGETSEYATELAEEASAVAEPAAELDSASVAAPAKETAAKKQPAREKAKMSFFTAFRLSARNLWSKRGRTALVGFAGSIGIIGIALVLAFSAGIKGYVASMQDDMLSGNPIEIAETAYDLNMLTGMMNESQKEELIKQPNRVYISSLVEYLAKMSETTDTLMVENTITSEYISYVKAMPEEYYSAMLLSYGFDLAPSIFTDFKVSADSDPTSISVHRLTSVYTSVLKETEFKDYASYVTALAPSFSQVPDNKSYITSQYDIVAGEMAEGKGEVMLVLNSEDELSDLLLARLGYYTEDEFLEIVKKATSDDGSYNEALYRDSFTYDELLGRSFTWYANDDLFSITSASFGGTERYSVKYASSADQLPEDADGLELTVVGILTPKDNISYGCLSSGIYYTSALTEYVLERNATAALYDFLLDDEKSSSLAQGYYSLAYPYTYTYEGETKNAFGAITALSTMDMFGGMMGGGSGANIDPLEIRVNLIRLLGGNSMANRVLIYPLSFDEKMLVTEYLDAWNDEGASITVDGTDYTYEDRTDVTYTDTLELVINIITTMIDVISYALIAFTSVSLVVSTVMIGIITYVSVAERIKEIGVIRSLGGRKKDVSYLFNAETFIIGLLAGAIGIAATYAISIVVSAILAPFIGYSNIAALPFGQAVLLVALSVGLTLVSGLIPASSAAKKDPVVALRTE